MRCLRGKSRRKTKSIWNKTKSLGDSTHEVVGSLELGDAFVTWGSSSQAWEYQTSACFWRMLLILLAPNWHQQLCSQILPLCWCSTGAGCSCAMTGLYPGFSSLCLLTLLLKELSRESFLCAHRLVNVDTEILFPGVFCLRSAGSRSAPSNSRLF